MILGSDTGMYPWIGLVGLIEDSRPVDPYVSERKERVK